MWNHACDAKECSYKSLKFCVINIVFVELGINFIKSKYKEFQFQSTCPWKWELTSNDFSLVGVWTLTVRSAGWGVTNWAILACLVQNVHSYTNNFDFQYT